MKKSNAFWFATKTWLTSVFISPLPISIYFMGDEVLSLSEFLGTTSFIFFYGFTFSIPAWVIFILLTHLINNLKVGMDFKKSILIFFAILLLYTSFIIPFGDLLHDFWFIPMSYLFTLIFGILYFELSLPAKVFQKEIHIKTLEDILDDENY